jgi:hypothetical protein
VSLDLWEASDEELATVDPLWDALLRMPGIGTATASKLLARKRPRLCPVSDKVVIQAVGVPGWTWEALRCLLQDPARADVEALRPPSAGAASLLRILDVAIWIRHSHSPAAIHVRRDTESPSHITAAPDSAHFPGFRQRTGSHATGPASCPAGSASQAYRAARYARGGTAVGWALSYVLGLRVFPCRAQSTIQASDTWCTRCTSTAR